MSNLTERAITQAFVELLNEYPLDKITVRQIAQKCGISRNTFYYHYHDIYDLLEQLFASEEERLLAGIDNIVTLQQTFTEATMFVRQNQRAIFHIYNSIGRDTLSSYLYNSARICMRNYILHQCEGVSPSEQDLNDLIFLYASMLEGAVINIMREGALRDTEALISNAIRMLEGTVRLALENSCTKEAVQRETSD